MLPGAIAQSMVLGDLRTPGVVEYRVPPYGVPRCAPDEDGLSTTTLADRRGPRDCSHDLRGGRHAAPGCGLVPLRGGRPDRALAARPQVGSVRRRVLYGPRDHRLFRFARGRGPRLVGEGQPLARDLRHLGYRDPLVSDEALRNRPDQSGGGIRGDSQGIAGPPFPPCRQSGSSWASTREIPASCSSLPNSSSAAAPPTSSRRKRPGRRRRRSTD